MNLRAKTRGVKVGSVQIGGGAPVSVQSMTKCATADVDRVLEQVRALATVGCDIVRVAVPDEDAVRAISAIKKASPLPIVADIHFDHRLAIGAIEAGVDGLRINPGNMQRDAHLRAVVGQAKQAGIPIRIGVNSGSIQRSLLKKHGGPTADAMVESALECAAKFEKWHFEDIVLSLKSHDVAQTVLAYRKAAQVCDYALHLGITAAGSGFGATLSSAIGIGALLLDGIGDTIRVSLSANPVSEVLLGIKILQTVGLRSRGVQFIACPTCGRCKVDLIQYLGTVKKRLSDLEGEITIAVMGCAVNGPGEARQADVGVAFGEDGSASLFKKGKRCASGTAEEIIGRLVHEARRLCDLH